MNGFFLDKFADYNHRKVKHILSQMSEIISFNDQLSREKFCALVLEDYKKIVLSREVSKLSRREVLQGFASFGVSGDGKELPQVVLSHYFKKGDFLSGYYRDQTFCFAKNIISEKEFFAQLYADTEHGHDPSSGGRQMNNHFATQFVDINGSWLDLSNRFNIPANMSQTAGQMPRAIGFGYVSKLARILKKLNKSLPRKISQDGNEVCFCTIGDGSTAEGHFWESIHTATALQVPVAVFIWNDGYGISVPSSDHMVKGNIVEALRGMERQGEESKALDIYNIKGWDYNDLHQKISAGVAKVRATHSPAIFHIEELTQPLGHSTSGSHERYKSEARLAWENEYDCNAKMREWILEHGIATEETLLAVEQEQIQHANNVQKQAWQAYITPINQQREKAEEILVKLSKRVAKEEDIKNEIDKTLQQWQRHSPRHRSEIFAALRTIHNLSEAQQIEYQPLTEYIKKLKEDNQEKYNSFLYTKNKSAAAVKHVPPRYAAKKEYMSGYKVINEYFKSLFERKEEVYAFGEDLGNIGDVNQGFSNLQEMFGEHRIFDTSIRELTIVGQAVGMAMRGLRPIAEIQYIDYLLYGLQPLSDDVATLHFRTAGKQSCPLIIRTRGHRLEGIWHSGSPMSLLANTMRGVMIGVPRNMTQAAAMYNALMESNDPGIVVESLNGYRLKERVCKNLSTIKLPFGLCEVMREGTDITLVSYGSTLRIVLEAAEQLQLRFNISCEVIDIQTLAPFDTHDMIVTSLKKTNRVLFIDEDISGGFTAAMVDEVINKRGGFYYLDAAPRTLTAQEHRTSYGRDGEYFGKPSLEDIIEVTIQVAKE